MNIGDKIIALRKAKDMSQQISARPLACLGRSLSAMSATRYSLPWKSQKKMLMLEVCLDYLAGEGTQASVNKQTMKLIHDIEELESSIKDELFFLANAVIRDAKTKKAYTH